MFLFSCHHHYSAGYCPHLYHLRIKMPGHPMTSGLCSRHEERKKAEGIMGKPVTHSPNYNSGGICNQIIFVSSFLCDLNFSKDCILNFVRNNIMNLFPFCRKTSQGNHKSLSKSVSLHFSVILSIILSFIFSTDHLLDFFFWKMSCSEN